MSESETPELEPTGGETPDRDAEATGDARMILVGRLVRAREDRNWSQEDLSDRTRISLHVVQGIEAGDFNIVEPPFLRAFLRTYARHVGVPVDEVSAVFPEPRVVVSAPEEEDRSIPVVPRRKIHWGPVLKGLLAVAVLIGIWLWQPWARREVHPKRAEVSVAPAKQAIADSLAVKQMAAADTAAHRTETEQEPAGTEPVLKPLPAPPMVAAAPEKKSAEIPGHFRTMTIRATDSVWVHLTKPDSTVIYDAIMAPGFERTWLLNDTIRVSLGRYWATDLLLDTTKVDVPHGTRDVTTFLCTPAGVSRR